jgi:hypothetical protein
MIPAMPMITADVGSDCRKSQWLKGGSPWIRWAIESGCFLGGWSFFLFSLEAYFPIHDHLPRDCRLG